MSVGGPNRGNSQHDMDFLTQLALTGTYDANGQPASVLAVLINKTARPQNVTLDIGVSINGNGSTTSAARARTRTLMVTIVDVDGEHERELDLAAGDVPLELPPFAVAFAAASEQ